MKVDKARGMNISVVTTAKTDEESRKLLQLLGMPFRQAQSPYGRLREKTKANMATTAKIAKEAKTPKFKVRLRNRCQRCGRPAGLPAEVRALPALLPQAGARGRHRRRDEEQLVDSRQLSARQSVSRRSETTESWRCDD